MPFNDKYRVAFVHIPKNGGTTAEYLLGMHGEIKTIGKLPYHDQVENEFLFGAGSQELTADELRAAIGASKYKSYTSFCISRDPYSRFVSYVAWYKRFQPHATDEKLGKSEFKSELDKYYRHYEEHGFQDLYLKPQNSYVYGSDGLLRVDHVFRFEMYDEILKFISSITGKPIVNNERRMLSNHYDIDFYLDASVTTKINEMYQNDFELFKYNKIT